jgi:peptide/nickel transport system substrate-binding protein
MVDNVTVIPTVYRSGLHPVSDNVVNYGVEIGFNEETALYNVGLAEE